jgi:hypothetical protein
MGNKPSVGVTHLPQDPFYVRHCQEQPERKTFFFLDSSLLFVFVCCLVPSMFDLEQTQIVRWFLKSFFFFSFVFFCLSVRCELTVRHFRLSAASIGNLLFLFWLCLKNFFFLDFFFSLSLEFGCCRRENTSNFEIEGGRRARLMFSASVFFFFFFFF